MVWNNDPYGMWTEDTPPGSASPSSSSSADENSESLKGLDWRDGLEGSVEDLECRRNATINDHSYANPIIHEAKSNRELFSMRSNAIKGTSISMSPCISR
jgi:hypothetical protein